MAENLYPHLKRLSKEEKAVLCRVLQFKWEHCHPGTLPFMNYEESLRWFRYWMLGNMNAFNFHRRLYDKLYDKLRNDPPEGEIIKLSDAKVFQRFGKHPERGVFIPTLPTWHRKRERKMFERKETFDIDGKKGAFDTVHHIIPLKHIGQNRWYVSCPQHLYPQVLSWLRDNVGWTTAKTRR